MEERNEPLENTFFNNPFFQNMFNAPEEVFLIKMFVCHRCSRQVEIEGEVSDGDVVECERCGSFYRIKDTSDK